MLNGCIVSVRYLVIAAMMEPANAVTLMYSMPRTVLVPLIGFDEFRALIVC